MSDPRIDAGLLTAAEERTVDPAPGKTTNYFEFRDVSKAFDQRVVLNHVNFNAPVANLHSATFGIIQSAGDPRILQFAAKFSF